MKHNPYLQRGVAERLEKLLKKFPVVVLTGARQTGKSTLVQNIPSAKERRYLTLDDLDILERAQETPEVLVEGDQPLTLDEVQRAPQLLLAIKREVDKDRTPGRFLLTGSANLLLMKKVSESLAGRAAFLILRPMTDAEKSGEPSAGLWPLLFQCRNVQDLAKALAARKGRPMGSWQERAFQGGFPPIFVKPSGEYGEEYTRDWMEGYVRTYLERDIRQLSEIGSLTEFRRLMKIAAHRTGNLLNQAEVARDSGISPATAYRYLNLLEISYQIERIPAYAVNRTKRLIKSPKIFWGDTGLACFLSDITSWEELGSLPQVGALCENWLLRQMDVWREVSTPHPQVFYWRTTSGAEVDFVIEHQQRLVPIEVKTTSRLRSRDWKHLLSFLEEYPKESPFGLVVTGGHRVEPVDRRILAVPANIFGAA